MNTPIPVDDCPQCGEPSDEFREGVCAPCCEENQAALDDHNSQYDYWNSLTDAQRGEAIRRACL